MTLSTGKTAALLIGTLCIATACSRSEPGAGTVAPAPAGKPASPGIATGTVCEQKLLTPDDLSGIFDEPFTGSEALQGDAQTCSFTTAGNNKLHITLRPGGGRAVIGTFTSGHMDAYAKWQPLAGVGEEAIWKPDLDEVSARSGDVLCEVAPEAGGMFLAKALKGAGETAKQQKLGGLCNTIFARLHLSGAAAVGSAPIGRSAGGNVVEAACEKDVTPADIAAVITAPVVKQRATINPQSCSYHAAAGATVTIALARGDEGKSFWDLMTNPANTGTQSPLAGVGDAALHARGGTQVIARKGTLVCSVDITGTDNADGMQVITKARGEELARKLGALCGKVFAARGAG
jgi:hypothetical protein